MIKYKFLIDGVDYTKDVALPSKEQYVLNSALDNGVMAVKMIPRKVIFKPFTPVSLQKDNDVYTMYVMSDKTTEIVGSGLYTHELVLIEETKVLEKIIVDTNTTTNPLSHDYLGNAGDVYVKSFYSIIGSDFKTRYYYNNLMKDVVVSTTTLPSLKDFIGIVQFEEENETVSITVTNTRTQQIVQGAGGITEPFIPSEPLPTNDIYEAKYYFFNRRTLTSITDTFRFVVIQQETPPAPKTITDVVNRLLLICDTLAEDEQPRFTFNEAQATKYSQVLAPEFSMTKSTLRECLDQVGGYIHAIVRLDNGIIYFDELGSNNETTLPRNYIGHYETLDAEQYATHLDSIVDNLVNIDNASEGTIVEPFSGGYETVRCETGTVRITNDSAIIETEYPIEKIEKLYVGFLNVDGYRDTPVGDITPYVYEESEYNALSATEDLFPKSKAYAIYYSMGQKNIKGLNFKLENVQDILKVFKDEAILNILERKTGKDLQNLFNVMPLTQLNFQIVYYPSTTARIKQSKAYLGDFNRELTSIYNQSANKVDSRAYGENLKGAIARLGNVEKFITYTFKSADDLPNVGDFVVIDDDDYYIATLNLENLTDYVRATIGLSKDFNQLSQYIGIKNNIRLYEVSERQTVERFVNRDDYCVIGDQITSDNKQLITESAIQLIKTQFTGETRTEKEISCVRAVGYSKGAARQSVDLPAFTLGAGNAIWLGFKYKDNYSAGNTSTELTLSSGAEYYRVQDYVPYGDYFGELDTLQLAFYSTLKELENYNETMSVGNALPRSRITTSRTPLVATKTNANLRIMKDSRENINFGYQMYFVSNDRKIVIGSNIAYGNPLVNNTTTSAKLYILPTRINKFDKVVDLTNATLVRDYSTNTNQITYSANTLKFSDEIATANGKSWVVVDSATNTLLFGKNTSITNGETITMPYLSFTHKAINETN